MIQMFPGRTLIPAWVKIGAAVLATVATVSVVAHHWDRLWSWLPWSDERRLERVIDQRDQLAAKAASQAAYIEALIEQAGRVETIHRQVIELRDLTDPVIHEARSAPDASIPLEPDRADRLREHDRRLCGLAPGACASSAAADAGVRPETVSHRHPG